MWEPRKRYFFTLYILLLFLQNCASYKLDSAQRAIRKSFAKGNYEATANLVDKYKDRNIYKSKDNVLYLLEKGTAFHFSGHYDSSFVALHDAEMEMDRLFSKSITRGVSSFLLNDNQLAYDGEDYESIYINVFNSLNFIELNNMEGALVEARRVAYKLQNLNIRYKGLVSALAHADTTSQVEWRAGRSNIQNSALGHFLSAILYAKSGKSDDARIEYEQFLKSFQDQPGYFSSDGINFHDLKKVRNANDFNIAFFTFTGQSPVKYQTDIRAYLSDKNLYLKISVPVLRIIPSIVRSVHITIDDTLDIPLYLIENMDIVSTEVYRVKEPIIYSRALIRSFLKTMATKAAERKARKDGKAILGSLIDIAGKIATETTEKADLRGWQTMPGQAYVNILKLSLGSHDLHIDYIGVNGQLLFSQERKITITKNDPLKVVESLYWN